VKIRPIDPELATIRPLAVSAVQADAGLSGGGCAERVESSSPNVIAGRQFPC